MIKIKIKMFASHHLQMSYQTFHGICMIAPEKWNTVVSVESRESRGLQILVTTTCTFANRLACCNCRRQSLCACVWGGGEVPLKVGSRYRGTLYIIFQRPQTWWECIFTGTHPQGKCKTYTLCNQVGK